MIFFSWWKWMHTSSKPLIYKCSYCSIVPCQYIIYLPFTEQFIFIYMYIDIRTKLLKLERNGCVVFWIKQMHWKLSVGSLLCDISTISQQVSALHLSLFNVLVIGFMLWCTLNITLFYIYQRNKFSIVYHKYLIICC